MFSIQSFLNATILSRSGCKSWSALFVLITKSCLSSNRQSGLNITKSSSSSVPITMKYIWTCSRYSSGILFSILNFTKFFPPIHLISIALFSPISQSGESQTYFPFISSKSSDLRNQTSRTFCPVAISYFARAIASSSLPLRIASVSGVGVSRKNSSAMSSYIAVSCAFGHARTQSSLVPVIVPLRTSYHSGVH